MRSAVCLHTNQSRSYLNHLVLLPTSYRTWPTCFSVCSQRHFCVIYSDVSNASDLVPHTLLNSAPAQRPMHHLVCLVVEAIGPRPTAWTERPPQSACTPFTQAQCLLAVWRTDHPVALMVMSSQAKEGGDCRGYTSTTLGPFSLSAIWLLRWAQEQTVYIITGNCAYGNDFESRLKLSTQLAHDFIYLWGREFWLDNYLDFEPRLV